MKQLSSTTSRLAILLGAAAIIAVLPVRSEWRGAIPTLAGIEAMAKGGDSSGSGSSGSGSSDDSSGSGHSGSDDDGDDDHGGGSDDGPMHDSNDDNGGAGGTPSDNASGVVKFQAFGSSIEVVYADGTKEEIQAGRYERKNASGRTVEERAATEADRARLMALR